MLVVAFYRPFGLAALLAVSATAFHVVKWVGAAYLLWLAVGMARAAWRAAPPATLPREAQRTAWADFRAGLLTNVLNPKVALFFLAFLPQFIAPHTPGKTLAFLGLGAIFVVQGTLFLLAVVALAAPLRRLPASPTAGRWLNAVGAALFGLVALRLVASRP